MAAGEPAAVERFYRGHFDFMFAAARRATRGDEATCLDVVHDAVLRIVRCIRPIDGGESHLRNWTRLVVQSCALDRLRAESRRRRRECSVAGGRSEHLPDASPAIEGDDRADWLRQEIARFDPDLVRLIELRYVEGWTLARIAATVRSSVGAVDGKLRRALAKLGEAARAEGGPSP